MKDTLRVDVRSDASNRNDSDRVLFVRRLFGISKQDERFSLSSPVLVHTHGISLILGRSGSGKSTLMRELATICTDAIVVSESLVQDQSVPLIELFTQEAEQAIRVLGSVGLGEARLLITPFIHLSTGQRARALLAIALSSEHRIMIIDEFLTSLDRLTARFVAFNFQRICRERNQAAFIATSHDDLIDVIGPDYTTTISLDGRVSTEATSAAPSLLELSTICVEDGTRSDYEYLERFHYIHNLSSESPLTDSDWDALVSEVRVARLQGEIVGVLVCARPFPKVLESYELFRVINEQVLIFYRTIVHPGYRGVGIATQFLLPSDDCRQKVWLSCSALGQYIPFRASMGFTPVEHPRNARFSEHDELDTILCDEMVIDKESLHNYATATRVYRQLDSCAKEQVRALTETIMIRYNVTYCQFLATQIDAEFAPHCWGELERFFQRTLSHIDEDHFGTILSESLHIPVQGFLRSAT